MHPVWLQVFEDVFNIFISITIHCLELMGVVVVVSGAFSAFYGYFIRHAPSIRLSLAQSMAIGLEFKLGGEILRTVIARDWSEILTVGAIILLRAALNFLIHWEISHIQHDAEIIEYAQRPAKNHAVQHAQAHMHSLGYTDTEPDVHAAANADSETAAAKDAATPADRRCKDTADSKTNRSEE